MASKSVTTEVDVDIEFDLSDFDIEDIIDYLIDEGIEELSKEDRIRLANLLKTSTESAGFEITNLDDELKFDHFCKVHEKYTVAQIQQMLPE